MAINPTDQLIIDRSGTLYRAPVSDLPSGGGMTVTVYTDQAAFDADTPGANELVVLDGNGMPTEGALIARMQNLGRY